jgi:DNA-directed RNA polymerase subunit RPC12/RpoP
VGTQLQVDNWTHLESLPNGALCPDCGTNSGYHKTVWKDGQLGRLCRCGSCWPIALGGLKPVPTRFSDKIGVQPKHKPQSNYNARILYCRQCQTKFTYTKQGRPVRCSNCGSRAWDMSRYDRIVAGKQVQRYIGS